MSKSYTKRDPQQEITDKMIALIESGKLPWRKPWADRSGVGVMPMNGVSGNEYSGINVCLLWSAGDAYSDHRWLTYKQAQSLGGNVIKGEKSEPIIFFKKIEKERKTASGAIEKDSFGMLKFYNVFNIEQCENLNMDKLKGQPVAAIEPSEAKHVALDIAHACKATVKHGGNRACFIPSVDRIEMPDFDQFHTPTDYANTLLHELTHWTGHSSRLDRLKGKQFGDKDYAFEELIAELGSAFACASFGIELKEIDHASYLQSWLKALKNDKKYIIQAASQASKAIALIKESVAKQAANSIAA